MKLLVTGSSGLTGKCLLPLAQAFGFDTVSLTSDLKDAAAVKAEIHSLRPTHVAHLAGVSFVAHADYRAIYEINLFGSLNLLDALCELPEPVRILLASSANVYGNCANSPIDESITPVPVSHYAMSKLAIEHMARTYAEQLNLIITRPFNYTGPGQDANFVIPKLVEHFARRAPSIALGNLDVEREFNDVQMVCRAYLQLLQHGDPGQTYNVCSGQPYTLQHVIDTLTHITGYQIEVEVNPAFVRSNEVHRLCGSPAKLQALLARNGCSLDNPPLEDTLRRMLAAADATNA